MIKKKIQHFGFRHPTGKSDPSSPAKANRHLLSLNNDRNLPAATGKAHHLIEFLNVCPYVEENCFVPIGFPSLACIRSTRRAIDHYF
jgi:hypothetical protein